ncbi:DHHW family protein [Faecousia sp.]|uniref:DHHW family protein n=1 Tax=Faecousia sp. TaxID=2952921 RepID=UPI003AB2F328
MKRKASIATAAVFLAVLFGFSLLHLALPDREVSRSERRRLAQLPPLSSGFSDKLEEYMLDQFPLREQLRTVNSLVRLYGLGQADIHGIYLQGGGAFRMDGPLQEKQVRHAAAVFSAVQEKYFPSLPAHYVIVPDKNAKAETGRPRLDTETMRGIVREALPGMTEIDIWDLLSTDDYYKTDPHWRQERLLPVAAAICEALGADAPGTFTEKALSPFYGAYYGQAALPMAPDTLTYLESADTKAAEVTGPELDGAQPVYRPELLDGTDGYDVFLSGAQAVLTVTSPNVHNGRHLVLFRDSFGSSLAPLLLGSFERITLVDLRYISAARLADYADLSDATDVLYLCSTAVWNNGGTLRE